MSNYVSNYHPTKHLFQAPSITSAPKKGEMTTTGCLYSTGSPSLTRNSTISPACVKE